MIFEACKIQSKTPKLAAWGSHRTNARTARRSERGCREGGEGLKTLRVVQKTAEDCKKLGIRKVIVRILRNVEGCLTRPAPG